MTRPPLNTTARRPVLALVGLLVTGGGLVLGGCQDDPAPAEAPRRDPPAELSASHILVSFRDAERCPAGVTRSREQAHDRARRIAILLRTGNAELDALARRYSDDPAAARNEGYLGSFARGEIEPALEKALLGLAVGEIGGPVETPLGWHVIRREPLRLLRIHHLLVAHRDAHQVSRGVTRDRADAARIARALHRKVACDDADLCDLTARFSDDPENRLVCGDLGWIEPGLLEPEVERAVFALRPGEVSPVIESDYGFHLFWRE
jgi:peptidyl-prolyl cis-trans isomerase SurA